MHWCAYPSPTDSLIQAKKQLNKSANTEKQQTQSAQSSATCYENSRRDWQNSKMATKNELQKFLHRSIFKTQVFHRYRSIDRQEWEHKLCIRQLSHHKI